MNNVCIERNILEDTVKANMGMISLYHPSEFLEIVDSVPDANVRSVIMDTPYMQVAIDAVVQERRRQMQLFGDQNDNELYEWIGILGEEFGEFCEAVNETKFQNALHKERGGYNNVLKEVTQIAAVAVAIMESVYNRIHQEDQYANMSPEYRKIRESICRNWDDWKKKSANENILTSAHSRKLPINEKPTIWCDNQTIDENGVLTCMAHLAEARVFTCPYKDNQERLESQYPCSDYQRREMD